MSDCLFRLPPEAFGDPKLSRLALRVLAALGRHLNEDWQCWASQTKLGEHCGGISRQVIQKGLRQLKEAGYVVVLGRRHRACLYQVICPQNAQAGAAREEQDAPESYPQNAHPGGAQQALEDGRQGEKILPQGGQDPAAPGGALTLREPDNPLTPSARGNGKVPPPAGVPPSAEGNSPTPKSPTPRPPPIEGGGGAPPSVGAMHARRRQALAEMNPEARAVVTAAAFSSRGARRVAPRSPLQIASDSLSADRAQELLSAAAKMGVKAALSAFGFNRKGRPNGTPPQTAPPPDTS